MRKILGVALLLAVSTLHASTTAIKPIPGAKTYFRTPDMELPRVPAYGNNVAFTAQHDGHARLFRLDLPAGAPSGVFDPGQGEVLHFWSLDANRVVVAGLGQKGRQYFVQTLSAGAPKEV